MKSRRRSSIGTRSSPARPATDEQQRIVVLIDANLPPSLCWRLAPLLGDGRVDVDFKAVVKEFGPDCPDEVWVAKIAAEKWLPITNDGGRRGGGKRLPMLCREHDVVHIAVSSAIVRDRRSEHGPDDRGCLELDRRRVARPSMHEIRLKFRR